MSIAGKREGLNGARSSLFHEQIRIVKEMREVYGKPRFMVWENVPGAFSSNKGQDFRAVLEAIAGVKQPGITIPEPERKDTGGLKWNTAGTIVGDGYSIAWRVFDAQYWGVAQRRKRIYLVADFDGGCAGKILFKPDSLPWDFEKSAEAWQRAAGSIKEGWEMPESIVPEIYGTIERKEDGTLYTTKAQRTGCSMCGFGIHLEKRPHRFDQLKERNPKEWEYWMFKCCVDEETGEKFGWSRVLDYIGVDYL